MVATPQQQKERTAKYGLSIWFCSTQDGKANYNLGKNNVSRRMKKLAKQIGFKDWEKCTNHGIYAYGITKMVMA
jgi:hypothetical protein